MITHMSPGSVDPATKLAYVLPTMQLGLRPSTLQPEEIPLPMSPALSPSWSLLEEDVDDLTLDASPEIGDLPADEPLPSTPYPRIFVIGDAADAFGAIKAGHTAYWQAEVAARNIIRMAEYESCSCASPGQESAPLVLERYEPGAPGIKVSLGIVSASVSCIEHEPLLITWRCVDREERHCSR